MGELAADSLGTATWGPWARYEAAVNHIYAPFAATAMCANDFRFSSQALHFWALPLTARNAFSTGRLWK